MSEKENQLQKILDDILEDKNTNLTPNNIKKGVTVLGVTGNLSSGLDTSDATATADDILAPKTAYTAGGKVTGKMSASYVDVGEHISKTENILTSTTYMTMGFSKDNKFAIKLDYTSQELVLYIRNEDKSLSEIKRQALSVFLSTTVSYVGCNSISFSNYGACENADCVYVYVGLTDYNSFITVLNTKTYEFNYSTNGYAKFYNLNSATGNGQGEPIIGKFIFTKVTNLGTSFVHDTNNYKRMYSFLLNKDGSITKTLLTTFGTSGHLKNGNHGFDISEVCDGDVLEYNLNLTGWDYDNPATTFDRYLGYINANNTITMKSTKQSYIFSPSGKYATNGTTMYNCTFNLSGQTYSVSAIFTLPKTYTIVRFITDNIFLAWTSTKNIILVTVDYENKTTSEYLINLSYPLTQSSTFFKGIIDIVAYQYSLVEVTIEQLLHKIERQGNSFYNVSDANGIESEILKGKIVYNQNGKTVGTMPNNGAISKTLNAGASYTVPAGYTSGGKVQAKDLASQTVATATEYDLMATKTAWVNGEKIEGTIIPTYTETGDIANIQNENISRACDVRQDLGYYLKIESNKVNVYSLEDGLLQQSINANSAITSNTIYDAKFSRRPISSGSSIYNVIIFAAKLSGSTVAVTTGVARFDTQNPTTIKEHFVCNTTNGGENGGRFGSYGFTIVENDNYVYSTIKCYSNYYKSWTGNNELLYINNEANTITRRCEFGGIGAAGLVPQMTDDHRIVLVNCPNHLQLSRVNDNNSGMTSITSYAPSTNTPRIVLTDSGYFYYDKGYYDTNKELLYKYDSLPWGYNDVVLWCNGYLVRFNGTATVTVYSFDKDTFAIEMAKAFEVNGVPNCKYYNTGVNSHYAMTVNDYPEANGKTIAFSTANGIYYILYLDVENLKLDAVNIKGVGYYNTSSANAAANQLLAGNAMFTSKGKIRGSMQNNGTLNYTPTTTNQTIPVGYTSGGTIAGVNSSIDSNIMAENIKKDVSILGVTGTLEVGAISQEEYSACEQIADNILGDAYSYDRLEYLITKEQSYIQLPYKNNHTLSYEIVFQDIATPQWGVYLGDGAVSVQVQKDMDTRYYINHGGGASNGTMIAYDMTRKLVFRQEKANCYFNNELKATLGSGLEFSSNSYININCVGTNGDGTCNNSCNMKLYSFRLWDDFTTYCDLVPAKRNDGEVGMFDNITKNFYSSMGTVKFEAGGDM